MTTHGGPTTTDEQRHVRAPGLALERLRGAHDSFSRSLHPPDRISVLVAVGLAVVALLALLAVTPHGFELGDAPYYADYIRTRSLGYASKHIGYYILGIAFTWLAPLDFDFALNVLSALCAAAAVGLVSSVTFTLTGRRSAQIAAAGILLVPYVFAASAVNAEVYAPQLCFFLLSVQLALLGRALSSGFAFAIALLITPSTLLLAPVIVAICPTRRFLLRWIPAAAVPTMAVLAPVYEDFLWGAHGVLGLVPGNLDSWGARVAKEASELRGFSVAGAFAGVGLWVLARSRAHGLLLGGILCAWFAQFALGERYSDVPLQLPIYAFVAVLGGIGFAWLLHRLREMRFAEPSAYVVLVLAIGIAAAPTYRQVHAESAEADTMKASFQKIAVAAQPGDVAVAPYAVELLGRYYVGEDVLVWITDESLAGDYGPADQQDSTARLSEAVAGQRRVWLPGAFDASAHAYFAQQGYVIGRVGSMSVARPR